MSNPMISTQYRKCKTRGCSKRVWVGCAHFQSAGPIPNMISNTSNASSTQVKRRSAHLTRRLILRRRPQLPDLPGIPAQTGEILAPAPVLVLQKLDRQWFHPGFERRFARGIFDHDVVRFECDAEMGYVGPLVVHVDVQLGAGEELESASMLAMEDSWRLRWRGRGMCGL